ncbi:MAG: fused MFS/spermidine synthase [Burkholderiales bacterium]
MILFAATIFTSAFLLFLVQPIIAKQILPWFGGSAAVWTTCMVFFQLVLLAGYTYSDGIVRKLGPRTQAILHTVLIVVSLAWLPIIAGDSWKPEPGADPSTRILLLLLATVGLPYFLLSTTGPLVQAWFARRYPEAKVYRLFALSNFASLLSLLAYPPFIEPMVTLRVQSWVWSVVYALFAVLVIASAWHAASAQPASRVAANDSNANGGGADEQALAPTARDYILWFLLAGLGSLLLLSFTNHITQNVASVPFLWIVPLVLYLVTFILVFDVGSSRGKSGWYYRPVFLPLMFALIIGLAWGLDDSYAYLNVHVAIPMFCAALFVGCMFCHGELAALRPAPKYLTRFYLMLSIGGAAGGLMVGVVAPLAFRTFLELPLALIACGLLAAWVSWIAPGSAIKPLFKFGTPVVSLIVTVVAGWYLWSYVSYQYRDALVIHRDFYGTLRVKQDGDINHPDTKRSLVHGVINHGYQSTQEALRGKPISYFGPDSGIGRVVQFYGEENASIRVGVVGLGVGAIAGWGRSGDTYRIYELVPVVLDLAKSHFWYLTGSKAKIETVLGDGRLSLERDPPQNFDMLSIDAFSSDAIPMHLMTREALRLYKKQIKPDGAIVYNVTNRFINLAPMVKLLAEAEGMKAILISHNPDSDDYNYTDYVIVTANEKLLANTRFANPAEIDKLPGLKMWTDDFNNLFDVLR